MFSKTLVNKWCKREQHAENILQLHYDAPLYKVILMIIIIIWFSSNEFYTDNLNNIITIKLLNIWFKIIKFKKDKITFIRVYLFVSLHRWKPIKWRVEDFTTVSVNFVETIWQKYNQSNYSARVNTAYYIYIRAH